MNEWSTLAEFLRTPLRSEESRQVRDLETGLREKMTALEAAAASADVQLNFAALAIARHKASNTLRKNPAEIEHWERALQAFAQDLESGAGLSLAMMLEWNRLLRNAPTAGFREETQYLGAHKLLEHTEIAEALREFDGFVLGRAESALMKAGRIYQWLITIHPFPNGNGRTARLASDYVLMQEGWLPTVFPTPGASAVAIFPEDNQRVSPFTAFQRIFRGVERSVEILQLPPL